MSAVFMTRNSFRTINCVGKTLKVALEWAVTFDCYMKMEDNELDLKSLLCNRHQRPIITNVLIGSFIKAIFSHKEHGILKILCTRLYS